MADKEQVRKQRNREAAQRSYFRRKAEKEELEKKLEEAENKQIRLNRQIRQLQSQVAAYETAVAGIHHVCNRHGGPGSSTGSSGPSSSSDAFNQASTSGSAPSFDATQAESTGSFPTQHQTTSGLAPSYGITQVGSTGPVQFLLSRSRNSASCQTESVLCTTPQSGVDLSVPILSHQGSRPPVPTVTSQIPQQASQQENATEDLNFVQPKSLTSEQFGSSFMAASSQNNKASYQLSSTSQLCSTVPADMSATRMPSGLDYSGASIADGRYSQNPPTSSSDLFDLLTDFNIHHSPSSSSTTGPVRTSSDNRHNNAFEVADEFIKSTAITVAQTTSAQETSLQSKPEASLPAQDMVTVSQSKPDTQDHMPTAGLFNPTPCTDSITIGWVMEMNRTHEQMDTLARAVSGLPLSCSDSSLHFSDNASITATPGSSSVFNNVNPYTSFLDQQEGNTVTDIRNVHKEESFKLMATETTFSQIPTRANTADLYGVYNEPTIEMTPSMTQTNTTLNRFHHVDDANYLTGVPKLPDYVSSFHKDSTSKDSADTSNDTTTANCGSVPSGRMFRRNMDTKAHDMMDVTSSLRPADVNVKLKKKYK